MKKKTLNDYIEDVEESLKTIRNISRAGTASKKEFSEFAEENDTSEPSKPTALSKLAAPSKRSKPTAPGKSTEPTRSVEPSKPTEANGFDAYFDLIYTRDGFHVDASTLRSEHREEVLCTWAEDKKFAELYRLGLGAEKKERSPSLEFLIQVAESFFVCLAQMPELELVRERAAASPSDAHLQRLLAAVPFVIGSEHVSQAWIQGVFDGLGRVFATEIKHYNGRVEAYFSEKSAKLHAAERIFFHLVENKNDEFPFAFVATYATKVGAHVKHMPLAYALTEFKNDRKKLVELLSCLNKVAEISELIASFMETGELFHPLKITASEAYLFLKQIEAIESLGVLCRIPDWWRKKSMSVIKTVKLGEKKPAILGLDTLITLTPTLTVGGEELTKSDIKTILAQSDGLAFIKGKWVEVNHEKLKELLADLDQRETSITLLDAIRMHLKAKNDAEDDAVSNGKWLSSLFQKLRNPETMRKAAFPKSVNAKLRPYQVNGYTWLTHMDELQFGACLADDMGLGKTLQVLTYLEQLRLRGAVSGKDESKRASLRNSDVKNDIPTTSSGNVKVLLIVPASLLGNWEKEILKFVPSMDYRILHGLGAKKLGEALSKEMAFLNITTYGMASRIKELEAETWDVVILDEAQAIKNPASNQTKQIKKLQSKMRIAMTGTPIENDLTNLWSLFDFLNKGLLGTATEFKRFCKNLSNHPENYAKLKSMIAPFLLRRVKTDKRIIRDLPEKVEMIDYAGLSKKQVVLYKKIVSDLEKKLTETAGIARRGLILSTIVKLKQLCNHPSQYLGEADFPVEDSGKFQMLRDLCEVIYERRERVLVFTQFKEITEVLARFLRDIFHADGLVLHGFTTVKERNKIVEKFQSSSYIPFIVLSVKAGGTGLNLTNANHVIHFDRWWNPAVENQATDRAFRIGQNKDVMVHKLVCRETIEEKIDEMIESKKALAGELIESTENKWITEMSNEEVLELFTLGE